MNAAAWFARQSIHRFGDDHPFAPKNCTTLDVCGVKTRRTDPPLPTWERYWQGAEGACRATVGLFEGRWTVTYADPARSRYEARGNGRTFDDALDQARWQVETLWPIEAAAGIGGAL